MSRRSRLAGQLAMLALVGLLVVAFPGGFALAQDLPDPGATTQSNHTLVPIINLTSTPTETPTATATQTATPTSTATASPTPTSGGGGDGGDGDTSGDGQRLVVDKGSGPAGGVTSEEDCSNANYTTIQRAVDDAARGDTVVVCAGDGQYKPTDTIEITTPDITLRAKGDAEIATMEQTVIRTTAPGVTIRGFTFDHTVLKSQRFAIEAGARNTVVRNNSFELTGNSSGILLSDGLEPETGEPDPTLGPATGSRVLNNVLNESDETPYGIFTDADGTVIRDNTLYPRGDNSIISIKSTGNRTRIRNNTIIHKNPCRKNGPGDRSCDYTTEVILIGESNNPKRGSSNTLCGADGAPSSENVTEPASRTWARKNRLVNNYIANSPGSIRIAARGKWSKVFTALEGAVVKDNTFRNTTGLAVVSKNANIRNNTLAIGETRSGDTPPSESPTKGDPIQGICTVSNNTDIIGNYLAGFGWVGLHTGGSYNTLKNNVIQNNGGGISIGSAGIGRWRDEFPKPAWQVEGNRIINNTITNAQGADNSALKVQGTTEVAYNRIANNIVHTGFNGAGIGTSRQVGEIHHNIIINNTGSGIRLLGNVTAIHHNKITNNGQDGVRVSEGYHLSEFHHNLIDNNDGLGINKQNFDKTDGEWPILNATHNIWGCGGPSGGLRDPKTNRTANGTGDGLSAGDKIGVSNIHFDPFFVREDVTCPTGRSNPTPTPTPPTPTKTPTPTPTPTPEPPAPVSGNGTGTGGSGGNGTGGSGGNGTGCSGGSGSGGSGSGTGNTGKTGTPSEETAGKPPTATPPPATATPSPTATPTPTISPTPQVEPGFGMLTWLIGTIVLIALLVRRRLVPCTEENHE